ncbi:hypothetical protein OPW33_12900 [Vibrio europaeus]|uniref:hypothetical protein n=1 Tax=Vibrio europaeus TaxID=300876 RepID=UPI002340E9B6|nr:hypothetical protein [Vibrio europaeus]MDC5840221.1 hypothetical protein [Vibrio europaeus]
MSVNSQSLSSDTSKRHQFYTLRQSLRKVRRSETNQFGAFEYGVLYAVSEIQTLKSTMFEFLSLMDAVKDSLVPTNFESCVSKYKRVQSIRARIQAKKDKAA